MPIEDAPKEVRDNIVEAQTKAHQIEVLKAVDCFIQNLAIRAVEHDQSKLSPEEADLFNEFGPRLKNTTYGSDEYFEIMEKLKPSLDHHYANNRHHPDHFSDGIWGMNLLDLVEMFCDWLAATKRHADGDLRKSIHINSDRFGISDQLTAILLNSVAIFADNKVVGNPAENEENEDGKNETEVQGGV